MHSSLEQKKKEKPLQKTMASKNIFPSLALFLCLNLFFALVSGCGTCPKPTPPPKPKPSCPPPSSTPKGTCPIDTLKLGVCADVLGLVHAVVGSPPVTPCCSLLSGLANTEAALCLCTAIKANILGINLNIPVSLSLLLNVCSKEAPAGFKCS
ncbi:14 kDa proline-rich protein DC2.15-like [Lycium ferocissimum]|uniref:14 kDa proline-rich protein DC2.15-like n=1 Tax=Lycium ferocissimum TaxID=112874 RepID=UPI00281674C1|nr:14 kDa proline-rich protein DC2.15-like [Lycium ferocissimum]